MTEPVGKSATTGQNRIAAKRVISRVIEERFVVDQTRAQIGGQERWNDQATLDYLASYLQQEVQLPPAWEDKEQVAIGVTFRMAYSQLRAILSALMSSAVIILERRIRTALRHGDRTRRATPADGSAEPRTADHRTTPAGR